MNSVPMRHSYVHNTQSGVMLSIPVSVKLTKVEHPAIRKLLRSSYDCRPYHTFTSVGFEDAQPDRPEQHRIVPESIMTVPVFVAQA